MSKVTLINYTHIFAETGGILGEIATLLSMAAEYTIYTGIEQINDWVLKGIKYRSPALRRKEMERRMT